MKNKLLEKFEQKKFKDAIKLPAFRPGDTVRVDYRIDEQGAAAASDKKKVRLQSFEGVVTRLRKGKADGTFTVRKIGANNIGVERVFPMMSPNVAGVTVLASGMVRRSRLYYLRDLHGKAARIRSKFGGRTEATTTTTTEETGNK